MSNPPAAKISTPTRRSVKQMLPPPKSTRLPAKSKTPEPTPSLPSHPVLHTSDSKAHNQHSILNNNNSNNNSNSDALNNTHSNYNETLLSKPSARTLRTPPPPEISRELGQTLYPSLPSHRPTQPLDTKEHEAHAMRGSGEDTREEILRFYYAHRAELQQENDVFKVFCILRCAPLLLASSRMKWRACDQS